MAISARTAMAPKVPQKMTLRWVFLGRLRATRPMMRALSPASTRSIRTMAKRADSEAAEKNSANMMISDERRDEARRLSSELDGHLVDGPARRRAQHVQRKGAAQPQQAETGGEQPAGEQEFQQMPVAHRQHGGLAAQVEQAEFQAGLAEQRRIDGVGKRDEDHQDNHRSHKQLAAGR